MIFAVYAECSTYATSFYLPFQAEDRTKFLKEYITPAGNFGIWRKPYNSLKGHYHAGIDFANPGEKTGDIQPIFACSYGKVISLHSNGPSSFIIISHKMQSGSTVYSVYVHVADIMVSIGDTVTPYSVIASFIDADKLDKWGEYLNHLHFEMLREKPKYGGKHKGKDFYTSYSVTCKSIEQLNKLYYNPELFFKH